MVNLLARSALFAALTLTSGLAARAESILDQLPEDAVGFALVRNLEAANAKVEKVAKIFQELAPQPIPGPLPLIKAATGLGAGINEQGDAMLALLPGGEGVAEPRPLLVVAVSDYSQFAESINGDATGEVCRVAIAGEEVLVAKRGAYAVLMNVEHRDRLEALLSSNAKPIAAVEPLKEWLSKVDVAAVLTPSGIDLVTSLGQAGLAEQRAAMESQFSEPQFAEMLVQMQQTFALYDAVLGFLGAKIDAAAAGMAIDDKSNVKLVSQFILTKEGKLAEVASAESVQESPLAGHADEPYVVAAGGPIPPTYGETMSKAMQKLLKAFPKTHGFENLKEEDWQELEESWKASMQGIHSLSMIMLVGEDDDPLYSNIFSIMKVDDAKGYLGVYAKAMEKWNGLVARTSSDIKLKYEMSDVEIADKKGVLTTVDVAAAAGDENVPMFQNMLEAMFGEDGKMQMYIVAADDKTVVMGMSNEEGVKAAIERAVGGESGLAKSSSVQTAIKLLDKQAAWQGVVSPKGCVAWFSRLFDKMLAQFGGGVTMDIPEYPDSPPVAFSLKLTDGHFSTELAWPVETLQGLAAYIKKSQEAP
jgi:hypothetical protein